MKNLLKQISYLKHLIINFIAPIQIAIRIIEDKDDINQRYFPYKDEEVRKNLEKIKKMLEEFKESKTDTDLYLKIKFYELNHEISYLEKNLFELKKNLFSVDSYKLKSMSKKILDNVKQIEKIFEQIFILHKIKPS